MNSHLKIILLTSTVALTACGGGGSEAQSSICVKNCTNSSSFSSFSSNFSSSSSVRETNTDPAPSSIVIINGVMHPGLMSTKHQLTTLQQRYQNGDPKTIALVQDLLDYVTHEALPIRNPGIENSEAGGGALIYCGGFNKGRDGVTKVLACDWPAEDGITAYTYALLSEITQNKTYAATSLDYLNTWADENNFKGFDPDGLNAPLQHGWVLPWFTNAAEILRYHYDGWDDSHTEKMNGLVNRLLPLVTSDKIGAPQNWLHSRIEGHIAAAIWLSDPEMLTTAFNRWKAASRTYIYIDRDNGQPLPSINTQFSGTLVDYWDTQNFVAGLTMETCRDLDHQSLGMKSIFNSLMMGKNQGIDLFTGNDNKERLIAFLQVQPRWTQSKLDHPDSICKNPVIIQGNDTTGTRLSSKTIRYPYVLGYNLLNSSQVPLTHAKEDIDLSPTVKAARWVTKWESLLASSME